MLELKGVRAGYGEAVVLEDVSLQVPDNGSLAVLGRNGVGKSTLLLTLMGYTRLHSGSVFFKGQDITGLAPHRRAQLGIGWVAQEREVFPSLTLEENLTVAARPGAWNLKNIFQLFPRLEERRTNMGNQLSGGEQQMLAIARALMTNPELLLLDEPLEGLAPIIVEALSEAFTQLVADKNLALILVEQHTEIALSLTEDAVVIERGRIVHRARSAELALDPDMAARVLGLG
jgi:branched-chain amino acid transport system ATP-binding protein